MTTITKRITFNIAALSTTYVGTDDDTGLNQLQFDRDMAIIDTVMELPPAATIAAKFYLTKPPRSTGVQWFTQEINPATAGRVRKPAIGLRKGGIYQINAIQTAGAALGTTGNIVLTLQEM